MKCYTQAIIAILNQVLVSLESALLFKDIFCHSYFANATSVPFYQNHQELQSHLKYLKIVKHL